MNNYFSSDFTIGILGGGQLGKMLLYETRKYDIRTHVLDPNPQAPCKISCNKFTEGSLMDYDTVYNFGKQVDVLTFEIEAVNVEALEALEKEGKTVYPSAQTLRKIQNKGVQKEFYESNGIPTAQFKRYETKQLLTEAIVRKEHSFPFVWKSCEGGYDGKGVSVIRDDEDLIPLPEVSCIAEEMIPFKNELAVIVVRNPKGDVKTYPVVEMEFHPEANQVEYVICPARIEKTIADKARTVAKKVSESFEHVGILAVELFQTHNDEILVNEVAPRPHNSGHFSIEGSFTNQFEQHLRAILNLTLGSTKSKVGSVMVNLVGEEGYTGQVYYENIENIMSLNGVTPHIYGKRETRPFRKMGHVTIIDEDINEARRVAEKVKQKIKVISK
ncbi:5-(carboxyamino)imidazole ribonucleotide synthase [Croceibacter atlanticus]|jgi:5-(carboxyamino)imidazole ribonucleotide synthase|uniref:N5-carboxyaminoimidazole ribonucleotide synthase n=1 Tax=Croceibacter atlanticus (strain ATCC BAA-628 / JCM 21780 / CIP 108009 / IAM 15332 / KCTC 12090 / HTCC2559) TaxID=216432 RepID=A3U7I5_CROAH|nr:5-(carboxyamino)imidazole ribonucleotide synthase [Croceibacter atlanticus]EAP88202.1 phosphoribosylaminoimidazole carboxylase [Croceibacter atlanticus HTCC2559]MAM23455.1 5-(carboxyamino)imidazole ribonucleotide synthase [Croceibacter sp.]MBW4969657.1 5-(carboxyamino)imidazole ribonucleotide synthase [Croceibacter atlanticus]WSP33201.1 5-(carboxyamino)imidazole ribonucleotide synthase [Croceibacter atlanticus]|tara:strand:+ start:1940 stop:3097 length:1158 start_codon:yes stop_codon:yes gene_type:complete